MNCVVFLLFGFKPLGKGVLLMYVFIMAIFGDGWMLLSRLLIYFFICKSPEFVIT